MIDHLSEKEQVEIVKKWLRQYGVGIGIAVILGLCIGFGWRYWQNHLNSVHERASFTYAQFMGARQQKQMDVMTSLAQQLKTQFPQSPYTSLAVMQLAKEDIDNNYLPAAVDQFEWVLQHGKINSLKSIARISNARVLLAEKKPEEALALLDAVTDKAYQPLFNEVKGDVYASMGQENKAKQFYQQAYDELQSNKINDPLLDLKLSQ